MIGSKCQTLRKCCSISVWRFNVTTVLYTTRMRFQLVERVDSVTASLLGHIASVAIPLHYGAAIPKARQREIDMVKAADRFQHLASITALMSSVRLTTCVRWTYCVDPMPTRTVPNLSARYLPEWAIYCHSNFGAQRHIYEVTKRRQTNKTVVWNLLIGLGLNPITMFMGWHASLG